MEVRQICVLMCTDFHRALPKASKAAGALLQCLWNDKTLQSSLKKVRCLINVYNLLIIMLL